MTIRQLSELVEGEIVAEREYADVTPSDILDVLRLMLANCSDFIKDEGIPLRQEQLELKVLEFTYPGVAGRIQVLFPD